MWGIVIALEPELHKGVVRNSMGEKFHFSTRYSDALGGAEIRDFIEFAPGPPFPGRHSRSARFPVLIAKKFNPHQSCSAAGTREQEPLNPFGAGVTHRAAPGPPVIGGPDNSPKHAAEVTANADAIHSGREATASTGDSIAGATSAQQS